MEAAYVGYCYGDSTCGQVCFRAPTGSVSVRYSCSDLSQRALYNLGLTGIPITNVNNNCSTGSTALYNANTLVKSGLVECALALGFERMARGSLGTNFPDRPSPTAPLNTTALDVEESLSSGKNFGPWAPRMFANGAQEYFDKYGANITHLAQIGECPPTAVGPFA